MVRATRPMTIAYKWHTLKVDMPGWYCEQCGEGVHTGRDMIVSDRALIRLKAQVDGLLLPETVKRIRKRLKLTQREAGTIIGGGPNAFQKYESGEVLVSKAVASALLLLDRDPEGFSISKTRGTDHNAAA